MLIVIKMRDSWKILLPISGLMIGLLVAEGILRLMGMERGEVPVAFAPSSFTPL